MTISLLRKRPRAQHPVDDPPTSLVAGGQGKLGEDVEAAAPTTVWTLLTGFAVLLLSVLLR